MRPDLSVGVSLSQRKDMTIEQLNQIYKLNNYTIATADVGLKIQKVNHAWLDSATPAGATPNRTGPKQV